MMRKIKEDTEYEGEDSYNKIKVVEHIIAWNFWEYYILDDEKENPDWSITDDIQFAFVMGYANEFGDISRKEMKDSIISQTHDLDEVMPAEGYSWVN